MEVVCLNCKYKGNIKDELVPDLGREVTCPHCKAEFFVRRKEKLESESEMVGNVVSEPSGSSFKPKFSSFEQIGAAIKPTFVVSFLLLTAVAFFVFGFFILATFYYSDSEPNTEISRSDDVAVKPPKTTKYDLNKPKPSDTPDFNDKPVEAPKAPKTIESGVELQELMKHILYRSRGQKKNFIEENRHLRIYGDGTFQKKGDIKELWPSYIGINPGDNKYCMEINLYNPKLNVILGLTTKDGGTAGFREGDKVKFSGKLLNFGNLHHDLPVVYLYDGKVVKD